MFNRLEIRHQGRVVRSLFAFGTVLLAATTVTGVLLEQGAVLASATTTPAISGTVTSNGSSGVGGICVSARAAITGSFAAAITAADGTYVISGLAAATNYNVEFNTTGCGSAGANPSYAHSVSYTSLVSAPQSAVNETLPAAASISGTVTSNGTTPLAGICVVASSFTSSSFGSAITASNGSYTVSGLSSGSSYNVSFNTPDCGSSGANPSYASSVSSGVAVSAPQSSVNETLPAAVAISGTVTSDGTTGIGGICVSATSITSRSAGNAITASNGSYLITGLTSGTYYLSFNTSICNGDTNPAYAGGISYASTVSAPQSSVNETLPAAVSITGTVSNATTSAGIGGICVSASSTTSSTFGYALTSGNGAFSIGGLAAGSYHVAFNTFDCNGSSDPAYATTVAYSSTVNAPQSAVNETLTPNGSGSSGATISGTVTSNGTTGVGGICVVANSGSAFGYALTATDGTYSISGLATGAYNISFNGTGCGSSGANPSYASNVSYGTAVSPPQSAVNETLPPATSISGTVTSDGTTGVGGICVSASSTSAASFASALTAPNGAYVLSGLASGSFHVSFNTLGCVNTGVDAAFASNVAFASSVSAPLTGVNETLPAAVAISGTVTSNGTTGVGGICVSASAIAGSNFGSALTASDGTYTIGGLTSGSYTVVFNTAGCGSGGANSAYAENLTYASSANAPQSAVNETLPAAASISGTVTDASSSSGIAGICVSAGSTVSSSFGDALTAADGTYDIVGLTAGATYHLSFNTLGCNGNVDASYSSNVSYPSSVVASQSAVDESLGLTGAIPQSLTFTSAPLSNEVVGATTYAVTASSTSGLAVALTVDASATGVCSLGGNGSVSFTGVGTCVIDANQAGNTNFDPATEVQQRISVGQGTQGISFTSAAPSNPTVGSTSYAPVAIGGGSGNPVTFSIDASSTAGACALSSSGIVSFTGIGSCIIDANQAGNANYAAAGEVQQSMTVGAAPLSPPQPPVAPSGAVSSSSASSTSPSGSASTTDAGVGVTATGIGALTVSQYASDPVGSLAFASGASYFDVQLAPSSSFASATVTDCSLAGATTLTWYNPSTATWESVVGAPGPTLSTGPPACLAATLTATTSPSLSQLTGTVFAAAKILEPKFGLAHTTRVSGSRAVLHVNCKVARCSGSITLAVRETVTVHKGHKGHKGYKVTHQIRLVSVGSKHFALAAGRKGEVTIALRALAQTLLARSAGHRLGVVATVLISGSPAQRSSLMLIKEAATPKR